MALSFKAESFLLLDINHPTTSNFNLKKTSLFKKSNYTLHVKRKQDGKMYFSVGAFEPSKILIKRKILSKFKFCIS